MPSNPNTYQNNFDSLIEHCLNVLNKHEAEMIVNLIEWRRIRRQVRREYKERLEYGSAEELKASLAIKYFGKSEAVSIIREMVERGEEAYYTKHPVKC